MSDSILIITYPDVGIGYKLAGVEVFEVNNAAEATSYLRKVTRDTSIGLIGIDAELYSNISPRLLESLKKRQKPLVLSIQSIRDTKGSSVTAEEYIRELTLRTAGVIVNVEKES